MIKHNFIINNLIEALKSLLIKKKKNIIIFDCWFGQKYADNPRYLFEFLSNNKEKLGFTNVIWISRNKNIVEQIRKIGYESYLINSIESVRFHKTAKYHICNNLPVDKNNINGELLGQYSYRSKRINLWHGTGVIKTFNMASNEYKNKISKHPLLYKIKNFLYSNCSLFRKFFVDIGGWGDCYFLTTSKSEYEKFKKCYPLPRKNFIISGYPRNCYNVKLLPTESDVVNLINNYSATILYLPTFRNDDNKFDFNNLSQILSPMLKKNNILWIQKAHSADKNNNKNFYINNNILNLNSDFDINVLTPIITFVITDYSSILADAIYYNKPILLFVPDYEQYINGDRGFSDDAEYLLTAANKFYNATSLYDYINENYKFPENMKPKEYNNIRIRIWGQKNKSIEQIWQDIIEQTK